MGPADALAGIIQRPAKREPTDNENQRREAAHWNTELGFIHAAVLAGQVLGCEVAQGARSDAEDAADEGAGEEVAVLTDGQGVWGRGEYLGERIGGGYEERLRESICDRIPGLRLTE